MAGWITTVLNAVQDWVRFERLDETDGTITAPRTITFSGFAIPEHFCVGRKLWIRTEAFDDYGPFQVAAMAPGGASVTIDQDWPADLLAFIGTGGQFTYRLQTWFAAKLRRMDFITREPGSRPIARPAGTDMPLLVMAPTVDEHPIGQFTNLQIAFDLKMHWELWAPGLFCDQLTDLLGELIDLLLAGRINRSGSVNRPFRIGDSTTGYQRMTFGSAQVREVNDYDQQGIAKNTRFMGTLDTECLILRRQP